MVLLASFAIAIPVLGCAKAAPPKADPPMTLAEARQYVDPAVRWSPPNIDPKQNGWDLMVKATQLIPITKADDESESDDAPISKERLERPSDLIGLINRPGEKDIVARCQKALASYKPAIDAIREATSRPYWYAPNLDDLKVPVPWGTIGLDFPVYAKVKDLCKTLVLSANLNMKLKKSQATADDLILCHKIADRMIESHKDLITLLVGYAADAIASRSIQTLCANPLMKRSDLQKIVANYRERRMGTDLAETLKSEHDRFFVSTIAGATYPSKDIGFEYGDDEEISQKLLEGHPNPFDRKATLKLGSSHYKRVVQRVFQPFGRKENLDNLGADLLQGWPPDLLDESDVVVKRTLTSSQISEYRSKLAKVDNPIGNALVSMMLPVFSESDQADAKAVANSRATRIILAIQIYKRLTDKYPASLSELASKGIVKAVPLDPFVNKPYCYNSARKVLWSVGPNLKDDGGKDRVGSVNGKDFVWPVDGVFPKGPTSMPIAPPPGAGPMGPIPGGPPKMK